MKKSENNSIILGFSFQFYVFGLSSSNGFDTKHKMIIISHEFKSFAKNEPQISFLNTNLVNIKGRQSFWCLQFF